MSKDKLTTTCVSWARVGGFVGAALVFYLFGFDSSSSGASGLLLAGLKGGIGGGLGAAIFYNLPRVLFARQRRTKLVSLAVVSALVAAALLITGTYTDRLKPVTDLFSQSLLEKHYQQTIDRGEVSADTIRFLEWIIHLHKASPYKELREIDAAAWKKQARRSRWHHPSDGYFKITQRDHFYLLHLFRLAAHKNRDADLALLALNVGLDLVVRPTPLPKLEEVLAANGGREAIISDLNTLCSQLSEELTPVLAGLTSPARGYVELEDRFGQYDSWYQSRLIDCAVTSNKRSYYDAVLVFFTDALKDVNHPEVRTRYRHIREYLVHHSASERDLAL